MTQEQLNQSGFVVNERTIEKMTYRTYLDEYGADECTSPHGVTNREHIREVEYEDGIEYQVWSWGTGGNNLHLVDAFDNEEDAELHLYEGKEWYLQEKNWDAPHWCGSYDDAVTELAEREDRSEAVIRRYLALAAITERKEAEHRAEMTRQHEARKAWLAVEVPREADALAIDDQFRDAVKWADDAKGSEKNNRMASAMKGLLERNGKEKIESDFWQVARILKARV